MFYHMKMQKVPRTKLQTSSIQSFPAAEIQWLIKKLQTLLGNPEFLTRSAALDAGALLQSANADDQLEGLRRMLQLDSEAEKKFFRKASVPQKMQRITQALSQLIARRKIEQAVQEQVAENYRRHYQQDLQQMRLQALQALSGKTENASTLHRLCQLQKMEATSLPLSAMERLRPETFAELVGQDEAVQSIICRLHTPYPQHLLLYGPPGAGKTSSARLALEQVKQMPLSPFSQEAPFIEADGASLRWDPREAVNPLLGSVHDPIFQGARKELAQEGIPEPKLGLVCKAHGGILFIDEIGAMEPSLQNQLLKVLEDKRVMFDSSYYDPQNPQLPEYVRHLFEKGAPADFILIGATTSPPEAISPAFRSRCAEIFFKPLSAEQLTEILEKSAQKLHAQVERPLLEYIARCCQDARSANSLLADACSIALNRLRTPLESSFAVTTEDIEAALRCTHITPYIPKRPDTAPRVGQIFSVGVTQYAGQLLTLECAAFPCASQGCGQIRYNATAGGALQDAAYNAVTALRSILKENPLDYDLHLNFIGGNRVDGPSAGAAMALVMQSAIENRPIKQDVAITGEISLHGDICPVGGLAQKIEAARTAGMHTLLVPAENSLPIIPDSDGLRIIPVQTLRETLQHIFADSKTD